QSNVFAVGGSSSRVVQSGTATAGASAAAVRIYPNPAEAWVEVVGSGGALDLRLHDVSGRQLLDERRAGSRTRLDVSHLHPGLYVLTVNGHRHKLVKQ
ncbi:MAG: T9SS type A sorting domain-containing protein, partial [Catalinimonas sp.]